MQVSNTFPGFPGVLYTFQMILGIGCTDTLLEVLQGMGEFKEVELASDAEVLEENRDMLKSKAKSYLRRISLLEEVEQDEEEESNFNEHNVFSE